MEMSQKINTARNAGVSDDEIAKFISEKDKSFGEKYSQASQKGASSTEVLDYVKRKEVEEFQKLPYSLQEAKLQAASAHSAKQAGRSVIEGAIPGSNRAFKALEEGGYIDPQDKGELAEMGQMIAHGVGAIAPITGAVKGVDKLLSLTPKLVQKAASYGLGGAAAGVTYGTGKKLLEEGELPTLGEAGFDAALFGGPQLLGKIIPPVFNAGKNLVKNVISPGETNEITNSITQNASKSRYDAAKRASSFFDETTPPPPPSPPGLPPAVPPTPPPAPPSPPGPFREIHTTHPGRNTSLQGRVTRRQSQELGLAPAVTPRNPNPEQAIRGIFPAPRQSSTRAGEAVTHNVRGRAEGAWDTVNELYNESRASLEGVEGEFPQLVENLQNRIARIRSTPHPDTHSQGVAETSERLVNRLVRVNEEGEIIEYRPMSAQTLVDQLQATRRQMKVNSLSGDAANVYSPLITELENAISEVADTAPWNAARAARRQYGDMYGNKYVKKFLQTDNYDIAKNFTSLENKDNFNVVRRILDQTPEGVQLRNGIQERIAENHLKDFWNNPRDANPHHLREAIEELRDVLEPQQIQAIEEVFANETRPFNRKANREATIPEVQKIEAERVAKAKKATDEFQREQRKVAADRNRAEKAEAKRRQLEAQAGKVMSLKPEQVLKKFDSRSGIIEAKAKLKSEPNLLDNLIANKTADIVYGGSIEGNPTGKQLTERLLKSNNYDLMVEMHGQDVVDGAIEAAKEIGDNEITRETVLNTAKKALALKNLGLIAVAL